MHKVTRGRLSAFTLLEVVLALAIVSVALTALIKALLVIGGGQNDAVHYTKALYLAQGACAYARTLDGRDGRGVFEPPFERFTWDVTQESSPSGRYRELLVRITWDEAGRESGFSAATCRLRHKKQ